jgi:hypothetical protein
MNCTNHHMMESAQTLASAYIVLRLILHNDAA